MPAIGCSAGDAIEVLYRYTPEYNQTVNVQPEWVGGADAAGDGGWCVGLTLPKRRGLRITAAAATRLREPEVSLALKDYERPHFTVLGEVGDAGAGTSCGGP